MRFFWWTKTEPDDALLAKFYFHDPANGNFSHDQKGNPDRAFIDNLIQQQYTEISWQTAQAMGLPV